MQGGVQFNIEEVQRKGGSMQLENLKILRIRVEKRVTLEQVEIGKRTG